VRSGDRRRGQGRELDVRAGIHTGECELIGDKIAGIAVVTSARISSLASPGEVLVSSTVKDLVAGSGFVVEERGEHGLKGVPGAWRLYAVADG
jgi:class 3 adenylate cyclase